MLDYIIMRHGETTFNVEGRHQCRVDSPLTQKGKQEMHQIGEVLKQAVEDGRIEPVSKIYASDLGRVVQSVKILSGYFPDVPVEYTEVLREHNMGAYDGLTKKEVEKKAPGFTARRNKDKWSVRAPKGENYQDVQERVLPFISKIKKEHNGEKTIMIVGSRAINRVMIGTLLGYSREKIIGIEQPTGAACLIKEGKLEYIS